MNKNHIETIYAVFGAIIALILGVAWLQSTNTAFPRSLPAGISAVLFGIAGLTCLIYKYRSNFGLPWRREKTNREEQK
jgi:hypothetical protein